MIYEYAVLLEPTAEERKAGTKSRIIVPITPIVASSEKEATMIAIRSIPTEHADKTDRLEVAVRTF